MSLVGKTIPRRLHRLTSFSIVTGRLVAGAAFSADNKKFLLIAPAALARRANRGAYHGPECLAIFTIHRILPRFARGPEGATAFSLSRACGVWPFSRSSCYKS